MNTSETSNGFQNLTLSFVSPYWLAWAWDPRSEHGPAGILFLHLLFHQHQRSRPKLAAEYGKHHRRFHHWKTHKRGSKSWSHAHHWVQWVLLLNVGMMSPWTKVLSGCIGYTWTLIKSVQSIITVTGHCSFIFIFIDVDKNMINWWWCTQTGNVGERIPLLNILNALSQLVKLCVW